jgi:hypothetical protein
MYFKPLTVSSVRHRMLKYVAQGLLSQISHIGFVAKLVLWDNILTIIEVLTLHFRVKKTGLVCATKLLEGLVNHWSIKTEHCSRQLIRISFNC